MKGKKLGKKGILLFVFPIILLWALRIPSPNIDVFAQTPGDDRLYLPFLSSSPQTTQPSPTAQPVTTPTTIPPQVPSNGYRVNAPFFSDGVDFDEMGVFWFGHVSPSDISSDVRVGYSPTGLQVNLQIIDHKLWYDETPAVNSLTDWDSVELLLAPQGTSKPLYRFIGQLNQWEPEADWQAAYTSTGSGWQLSNLSFTTVSGWRGDMTNDENQDSRGWTMDFQIPFSSLGLSSQPTSQTAWKIALIVHNRDHSSGPMNPDSIWPDEMDPASTSTWGHLVFGLPQYTPAASSTGGTVIVRQGQNGTSVKDASVGGWTVCGEGTDFWSTWGDTNESFYDPDRGTLNIQNEADISDFPCFSRYYVTFPLSSIPSGKVIQSARLTLHQFGNSDPNQALPSYIQVLRVAGDWDPDTITWNNAPKAVENYSGLWIDPLLNFPNWPGIARTWDVTQAVVDAIKVGTPLQLALYSADSKYHSGKYFTTSDVDDWDSTGRPTLEVTWGNPK